MRLLLVILQALFAAVQLVGAGPDRQLPHPVLRMGSPLRGKAILRADQTHLKKLAAWHRMPESRLREVVASDSAICMDARGRLHYTCAALSALINARASVEPRSTTLQGNTASEVFKLHSLPGANLTIHIDFDGHTTVGTDWNTNVSSGSPIITPPYDSDGNTSAFSDAELASIKQIWEQVSEDYAPFKVDVTTEDPGPDALTKSNPSDASYGIRICVGGSSYDWYGSGAGGVAYLNSFDEPTDTPAFVFEAQLGNGNPHYTAEAVAHEAGHTFGLLHDGVTGGTPYFEGHADWASIMGVSYYKAITHWSKGEYASANNVHDDLALIAGYTGLRTDDHGGTTSTATPTGASAVTQRGLIHSRSDRDFFKFATEAGPVTIQGSLTTAKPNLNIELRIYDSLGTLLLTQSPTSELSANLSLTVPRGTYYVRVDGVGEGSPINDGFSDYGSVGNYELKILPTENSSISVAGIAMSRQFSSEGAITTAIVRVVNQNGVPVSGVQVAGTWSGNTSGVVSRATVTNGQAAFSTSRLLTVGTTTFTVNELAHAMATYNASANRESSDSIQ
ncbi:MAG: zinc-dependent metalloprotease [Verrucomicrobiaceae bacterium]|nr:zinc-dependent metalloprotease [Verrucomicrobiaceae bacterium]